MHVLLWACLGVFGDRQGYTRDLPTSVIYPCVVISACNRPKLLRAALESWLISGARPRVSVDCPGAEVPNVVRDLGLEMRWSHQIDVRDPWPSDERVSRHWLNAVSNEFKNTRCTHVIYAEDDHIVTPAALHDTLLMLEQTSYVPGLFAYNMGCHGDCWGMRSRDPRAVARMEAGNMGVVYSRQQWKRFIHRGLRAFCALKGSWDVNMHVIAYRGIVPVHALTFLQPRISHISGCISSRTGYVAKQDKPCDVSDVAARLGNPVLRGLLHGTHHIAPFVLQTNAPYADAETKRRCIEAAA